MPTPEYKIKAKFNKRLKEIKLVWRFMPVPSGYGLPSLDYLLCVGGYFVAVEAKAGPKKQPTPRQDATMAEIKAAGGFVFVIYDDDSIERCIAEIKRLAWRRAFGDLRASTWPSTTHAVAYDAKQ